MKITTLFNEEYIQYAMYDSYRSIASYIDGMKPSARKVVYTVRKLNINSASKKVRVANLAPTTAKETEYLHGESSLYGVIVGMATKYVGTNNINLLVPSGNFGKRFITDYSAPRYIYTYSAPRFDEIFDKRDEDLLHFQEFEGSIIEPSYYVPTLPLLLVNGSEGIGNGYAQKILPRCEATLKTYIRTKIAGKKPRIKLLPSFNGFNGSIVQDEDNPSKYLIRGAVKRLNTTNLHITELPVGYQLEPYLKVLDKLVEDKVIKSYTDNSDRDVYDFKVNVTRGFTSTNTDDQIIKALKLEKSYTENYTCIDENNSIRVFESPEEIMDAYIEKRLEYYAKRKVSLLAEYSKKLTIATNRINFVKDINSGAVVVTKVPKAKIITQLDTKSYDKVDDTFNYLLSMPIYSLTNETVKELSAKVAEIKAEVKSLKAISVNDMWEADL
jgi:DNA topoisomerase II